MRRFVVSDIHGSGEVYNSIMGYLENVAKDEQVELFINGDLIDRGLESFLVFEDIIERINGKGNIKINYLAGNHELMMYQALMKRRPNEQIDNWSNWICNGGYMIEGELDQREDFEEKCSEYLNFLKNLKIYHKFNEEVDNKNIVLTHAQIPEVVKDECDLTIKDDNQEVTNLVWTRKEVRKLTFFGEGDLIGYNRIGNPNYLGIVGHTPTDTITGFIYDKNENYFNIDGGCACYACGYFNYDNVPLIEIKNGEIEIIIFNHNNKIRNGIVYNGEINFLSTTELEHRRDLINHKFDNCEGIVRKRIKEVYDL